MKIVMCASEVVPFAKTGGLADVVGALPSALEELGEEIIVVMPAYRCVLKNPQIKLKRLLPDVSYASMAKAIKVYFVENPAYFDRDGLYGDKNGDYPDNLDRFLFYCRRTLMLLKEINFKPDIIHCHDWQSALIPVYLKTAYRNDPFFAQTRTLFTIHNIGYQGLFAAEEFSKLNIEQRYFSMEYLEFYGKINLLKGGIVFADLINTVSPTYSKEIQTKEFGFGLDGVLRKRGNDVFGILNGLDYSIWNPQTDKFIPANYSPQDLHRKAENKRYLQQICGLPQEADIPLFGVVSRLAQQKGFDILAEGIDEICRHRLQLVILGTGDIKYHQLLEEMQRKYPEVISLHLKFDDVLAHRIYAGSDIFLMPSRYEPCGLGQLISFRYATIPLVFKTGGLADTVTSQTGFVFSEYSKTALIKAIEEAIAAFKDRDKWLELMQRVISLDFSWNESARKYKELYAKAKTK